MTFNIWELLVSIVLIAAATLQVRELIISIKQLRHPPRKVSEVNLDILDRIEVIDEEGWAYVRDNLISYHSLQDDGHTLKLFVRERGTA